MPSPSSEPARRTAASAPRATYRLQLHRGFSFADATSLVPYLAALGVSHVYASPILKARPGSTHGYDIIDHGALNPEIGSDADLARLSDALAAHGMGLVVDIVPNHMGVGPDNRWWMDVLEWGEASPFAEDFDIDWEARRTDLRGKVLLPLLGDQYGIVLEKGEIALRFDRAAGAFSVHYWEHRFPIFPRTYPAILARVTPPPEEAAAFDAVREGFVHLPAGRSRRRRRRAHDEGERLKAALAELAGRAPALAASLEDAAQRFSGTPGDSSSWRALHALFEQQNWRAAYWRTAADEINYRRFFNINDLAGIRVEHEDLFERAHRLILALVAEGRIQGLRVDHIDGLADPRGYCARLQHAASAAAGVADDAFYIVVEKILAPHEALRDWPIAGTTGYDFIAQLGGLFLDPDGEAPLTAIYERFVGRTSDFARILYDSRKRIISVNLASEVNVMARAFHALAMRDRRRRDFTLNLVRAALEEVLARFPVYRTYVTREGASIEDRRYIAWAVAQAKKHRPGTDASVFDFIAGVLTGDLARRGSGVNRAQVFRLAERFQQISGPVMAKGAEDTAFYRYNRLLSVNEVGGDPGRFATSVASFHHLMEARAKRTPHAMLAATTHDTKRGEDARARLHLLSERPDSWAERIERWERINALRRAEIEGERIPDPNDEYFFYETVVASWPPDLEPDDVERVRGFAERVAATMVKAVREAKERSGWSNPDTEYEAALLRFAASALDATKPNPFLQDLAAFVASLARLGAVNALAATLVRLTAPGVPDIYQGAELFDFDMVDPDNRRPVDFAARRRFLAELEGRARDGAIDRQGLAELAADWRDGRDKLFLVWRALGVRRANPDLFTLGAYQPLETQGRFGERLCAFARVRDGAAAATVVPRLTTALVDHDSAVAWHDSAVALPEGRRWRDAFSGRALDFPSGQAPVAALFADFPVALLISG